MPEIYVIVADSARARVFHAEGKTNPLVEIDLLEHPAGRLHSRDLTSDLPGHGANHVGAGKHKMDPASDPKQHELDNFSRDIANYLAELEKNRSIDQLMLAAPPAMLGMLRLHLAPSISNLITLELDKNLTQYKVDDLRACLPYFKPVERLMT
jgi:protein required for attachment to host cells